MVSIGGIPVGKLPCLYWYEEGFGVYVFPVLMFWLELFSAYNFFTVKRIVANKIINTTHFQSLEMLRAC